MTESSVTRLDLVFERLLILGVSAWSAWALYYWTLVLIFDASFLALKAWLPLYLALLVTLSVLLLRLVPGPAPDTLTAAQWPAWQEVKSRCGLLAVGAGVLALVAVSLVNWLGWSASPLGYNQLWAVLLPVALCFGYCLWRIAPAGEDASAQAALPLLVLDRWLLVITLFVCVPLVYGVGFPTPDDAFYGHVIAVTLANPELPVLGQDVLLGTSAPYSLHPSYRPAGVEVLVALVSDISGLEPLQLFYSLLPCLGVALWVLAAFQFMRVMGIPYAGFAVFVCAAGYLFATTQNSVAPSFVALHWGKTQVGIIAAPLLFYAVFVFLSRRCWQSWLLVFAAVCAILVWSSTALFVVPVSVGLAYLVFEEERPKWQIWAALGAALVPVALILAYSLWLLADAPVHTEGNTGALRLGGSVYGGAYAKEAMLLALLALPLLVRHSGYLYLSRRLLRLCLAGYLTVLAPYLVESLASLSGLHLIAHRLPTAFPMQLLVGIAAGVGLVILALALTRGELRTAKAPAVALAGVVVGLIFLAKDPGYLLGEERSFVHSLYYARYDEAVAARALIRADGFVAAGYLDELLPLLPDPPRFVAVRHYLHYHKFFLPDDEYLKRQWLNELLKELKPRKGREAQPTINRMVKVARDLNVSSLVFRATSRVGWVGSDPGQQAFIEALSMQLNQSGYQCATTASGKTRVCNRSSWSHVENLLAVAL